MAFGQSVQDSPMARPGVMKKRLRQGIATWYNPAMAMPISPDWPELPAAPDTQASPALELGEEGAPCLLSLLASPGFGGFRLLAPSPLAEPPSPLWVFQLLDQADLDRVQRGDIALLSRSSRAAGRFDPEVACEALARRGAAALGLEPSAEAAWLEAAGRSALPLVALPASMPLHEAARRLAKALAPSRIGSREKAVSGDSIRPSNEGPSGGEASPRRLLVVSPRESGGSLYLEELESALPQGIRAARLAETEAFEILGVSSSRGAVEDPSLPVADPAASLRAALRELAKDRGLSMGLSERYLADSGRALALEQARSALDRGKALMGGGHVSYHENMALYRAFLGERGSEMLLSFSRGTIERLREYDRVKGTRLLDTLEAYFRNETNARRASAELGIHRVTLKSRLSRIEQITDWPMDPEGRIGYELALAYRSLYVRK